MPGQQIACCYCIRKGLIRKAHLAFNAKKWAAKHPQGKLAGAIPETWPLEVYDVDYIDEALCDVPEVSRLDSGKHSSTRDVSWLAGGLLHYNSAIYATWTLPGTPTASHRLHR